MSARTYKYVAWKHSEDVHARLVAIFFFFFGGVGGGGGGGGTPRKNL